MALSPARIHAVEHRAPVRGFRAARARVQAENRIVRVVLAREQRLCLQCLQIVDEAVQHLPDLRDQLFIALFVAELNHVRNIPIGARKLVKALHGVLQALVFPHDFSRLLRVLPEIRLFHHAVQFCDAFLLVLKVQGALHLLKRLLIGGEGVFHII